MSAEACFCVGVVVAVAAVVVVMVVAEVSFRCVCITHDFTYGNYSYCTRNARNQVRQEPGVEK